MRLSGVNINRTNDDELVLIVGLCRMTAVQGVIGLPRSTMLLFIVQIARPIMDDCLGVALSPTRVDNAHVVLRIGPGDRA